MERPKFIRRCDKLVVDESFSCPGDAETFGIGANLSRKLGLKKIGMNYSFMMGV